MGQSQKENQRQNTQPPKKGYGIQWLFMLLAGLLFISIFLGISSSPREITWKEFETNLLHKKVIEKINVVNNQVAEVFIKMEFADQPEFKEVMKDRLTNQLNTGAHYQFNIGSVDAFEKKLEEAQRDIPASERISVNYITRSN